MPVKGSSFNVCTKSTTSAESDSVSMIKHAGSVRFRSARTIGASGTCTTSSSFSPVNWETSGEGSVKPKPK